MLRISGDREGSVPEPEIVIRMRTALVWIIRVISQGQVDESVACMFDMAGAYSWDILRHVASRDLWLMKRG